MAGIAKLTVEQLIYSHPTRLLRVAGVLFLATCAALPQAHAKSRACPNPPRATRYRGSLARMFGRPAPSKCQLRPTRVMAISLTQKCSDTNTVGVFRHSPSRRGGENRPHIANPFNTNTVGVFKYSHSRRGGTQAITDLRRKNFARRRAGCWSWLF